jgi:DNA-binding transcriptional LysR family regulator
VDADASPAPFRVGFVTGVVPDRWARTWRDRTPRAPLELVPVTEDAQLDGLRDGSLHMAFVRLPVDRDGLHLIPLWEERPVVVVSREHPVAAYDEIAVDDLAEEHLLQDPASVPEWRAVATEVREGTGHPVPAMTLRQAVASVAAEAGVLVLPMSVARLHSRKDVVAVPVAGVAPTRIGLAWPVEAGGAGDPRYETFVGIVRGRSANRTRGAAAAPAGGARRRRRSSPRH